MNTLTRTLALVTTVGLAVVPVSLGAAPPVPGPATPVPGRTIACRPQAPVVLQAGLAPLAPLRLDLTADSSVTRTLLMVDRARSRSTYADGSHRSTHTVATADAAVTTGQAISEEVPVDTRYHVSYAGSSAPAHDRSFTLRGGSMDVLNGGSSGSADGGAGEVANDHLPTDPVGVGATWRVVSCGSVLSIPVQDTRVYTLRSVTGGVMDAAFRDDIEIDAGRADLGSVGSGASKVHMHVLDVHGSSTGSMQLPLSDGFLQRTASSTHLRAAIEVTSGGRSSVVHSSMVESYREVPTGPLAGSSSGLGAG